MLCSGGAARDGPAAWSGRGQPVRAGLGAHPAAAPRSLHQAAAPRPAQHAGLLRTGTAVGRGGTPGWGRSFRASLDPLPRRSSCPLSSSALRCSSASSCRPSGDTQRCAWSPGCTAISSPSSGAPPVPECSAQPGAAVPRLCLFAAMTLRGTRTRPGCWPRSWPNRASVPRA